MSPEEILRDDLIEKLDLIEGQITRLASLRHNATVELSEKVLERDARFAWREELNRQGDYRRERGRVEKRADTAPIVRSVWQHNFGPDPHGPKDDDGVAPMHRFGSANVNDTPLSVGYESRSSKTAAVIPQEAIAAHKKKGGGG